MNQSAVGLTGTAGLTPPVLITLGELLSKGKRAITEGMDEKTRDGRPPRFKYLNVDHISLCYIQTLFPTSLAIVFLCLFGVFFFKLFFGCCLFARCLLAVWSLFVCLLIVVCLSVRYSS